MKPPSSLPELPPAPYNWPPAKSLSRPATAGRLATSSSWSQLQDLKKPPRTPAERQAAQRAAQLRAARMPASELHAAAYGELTSHKMSLLVLCATFISALWRGHVARTHAAHLRAVRDATILIAWYARDWLKRRRKHIAAEAEQEKESHGALDWRLNRLRALSRLREARARELIEAWLSEDDT